MVTDRPLIVQNDIVEAGPGTSNVAVSSNGTLVFERAIGGVQMDFVAVNRDRTILDSSVPPAEWHNLSIAPHSNRVAFERRKSGETASVWVADVASGALTRITDGATDALRPLWSRDGTRLVLSVVDELPPNLAVASADGSGEPRRVTQSRFFQEPSDWAPDDEAILFSSRAGDGVHQGIWIFELDSETVRPLIQEQANTYAASMSPEGDWLLFNSDSTGELHAYLTAFPDLGRRWQVSHKPAHSPAWRADGGEIFFEVDGDGVYAAEVRLGAEPVLSRPQRIFGPEDFGSDRVVWDWAPSPDGDRFHLLLRPRATNRLTVVLDWPTLIAD